MVMELSNLINSITLFTDVNNLKILIDNLKKFNNLINQQKRRYASFSKTNSGMKSNRKKSNISVYQSQAAMESAENLEEINQTFIDILLSIINIFGNYSIRTNFTFLLFRIWQGKAILANIMLPSIWLMIWNYIDNIRKWLT